MRPTLCLLNTRVLSPRRRTDRKQKTKSRFQSRALRRSGGRVSQVGPVPSPQPQPLALDWHRCCPSHTHTHTHTHTPSHNDTDPDGEESGEALAGTKILRDSCRWEVRAAAVVQLQNMAWYLLTLPDPTTQDAPLSFSIIWEERTLDLQCHTRLECK